MHQISSSLVVGFPHLCHIIITIFQCLHSCILTGGRRAHNSKLMNFYHLLHDHGRCTGIPESPPCHSISLGKTVDKNGSLLHARKTCNGHMLLLIGKLCIDFIGNHKKILFFHNLCNLLQIPFLHNCSRGIVRKRKHQYLCFIRDRILKLPGC